MDQALAAKPELAEQLKAALAEIGKANNPENKEGDLDSIVEKKLDEREKRARTKLEIDKWIEDHPDFKQNNELGHKILDYIEQEGLPFSAKTLQLVYDSLTKDTQIEQAKKKAIDEKLKSEEIADLERKEASAVGGGSQPHKTDNPTDDTFGSFVGSQVNPNRVRI